MRYSISCILILLSFLSFGQDPSRFAEEIEILLESTKDKKATNPIIFAGSSSFRLWDKLEATFPEKNIVNHGFGGSQTSDLIMYCPLLVTNYKPEKVFIYEGDNDLAEGKKSVDVVVADIKTLLRVIKRRTPDIPIFLVSPKPSISRWHLKDQYVELNAELKKLCASREEITFIDVWSPMIAKDGDLKRDLFVEDGLHMNDQGYSIWAKAIGEHL